jgi:hypothetical protein
MSIKVLQKYKKTFVSEISKEDNVQMELNA